MKIPMTIFAATAAARTIACGGPSGADLHYPRPVCHESCRHPLATALTIDPGLIQD